MNTIATETELNEWDVACILAQALGYAMHHVPEDRGDGEFARDDCQLALDAFEAVTRKRAALTPAPDEQDLRGRELDAALARALGHVVCPIGEGEEMRFARFGSVPPHYSTDPAAAAEVRREMERLGWRWMMDGPAPHHVMFFRDGSRDAAGKGKTEEEATVRGALAALGEE
jgi:hypothetical protein